MFFSIYLLERPEHFQSRKQKPLHPCPYLPFSLFFSHSQVIHDFLFSLKETPEKFQIVTNFPRRVLPCLPTEEQPNPPTLKEAGLSRSEVLFVQDLTDD